MSFISGPCLLVYKSYALGVIEDAYEEDWTPGGEVIAGDAYGKKTILDYVMQGNAFFLNLTLNEFNAAGAAAAFWPWSATQGVLGSQGGLGSQYAGSLVATRLNSSTAPFGAGKTSRTYGSATPAPNFNYKRLIGSTLSKVRLRMLVLPTTIASVDPQTPSTYDGSNARFYVDA